MRELDIKRLLIQKLTEEESINSLASEFPFDFGQRRADLVSISNNEVSGYEIKSYFDKLTNLPAQLSSYLSIFDYVYVVCDERHLSKVREIAPPKVGIYVCRDRNIICKRKAKKNNKLNSLVLLDAIPTPSLRKLFNVSAKSKLELCQVISQSSKIEKIRESFLTHLQQKYSVQTKLFQRDASNLVTLDDIHSLFSAAPNTLE
ncbi:sce7726 family protein [Pseudomonas resinovorans]|uniref:Sce7726 family protein n=1 Tax=Metapseudomonas resinovorans TaxID=53412 RepID=A0ABT4Y489_METRE|nr:sce7726 family protein [Pseudomonas resinovorans]MDA8483663.1 sce7726 family protein [Pseudomonas resinovorans]